jgi:hypothetical protein
MVLVVLRTVMGSCSIDHSIKNTCFFAGSDVVSVD